MEPTIDNILQKYGIKDKNNHKDSSRSFQTTQDNTLTSKYALEKIRCLEESKFQYETEIQRLKFEVTDLQTKNHNLSLQKEKELSLKSLDLQSDLKFLEGKCKNLEDQNVFLKTQIDFYEAESKRAQEQHKIDKENWSLQYDNLKRQLQFKEIEGNSASQSVRIEKEENLSLRDQVFKLKSNEKSLMDSVFELKKTLEREREDYNESMKNAEEDVKNLQKDFELNIEELKQEKR